MRKATHPRMENRPPRRRIGRSWSESRALRHATWLPSSLWSKHLHHAT